jgi:hypothetical protein
MLKQAFATRDKREYILLIASNLTEPIVPDNNNHD